MKQIIMNEQECHTNHFEFFGIPAVTTAGFKKKFGDDAMRIALSALYLIQEKYPEGNWDYLQTFTYGEDKFWIISDALQCGLDKEKRLERKRHITFLLPEDY